MDENPKASEFRKGVESGQILIDSHEQLLWLGFIYMELYKECGDGIFQIVELFHRYKWSFGQDNLRFNRTLDLFYLSQITAVFWRYTSYITEIYPSLDEFDTYYAENHQLLNPDAWKLYYTPEFLMKDVSVRFYRLPNLLDLPNFDGMDHPREQPVGHFSKIPRWVANVELTRRRQRKLSLETMTSIAESTLQENILELRRNCSLETQIQPYSATQVKFWLNYFKMDSQDLRVSIETWKPIAFGGEVAQGIWDLWEWKAHYSPERWESSMNTPLVLEPDLDGINKSPVAGCGWPEGVYVGVLAWLQGWDPELGSEEDIKFLAAVAVAETKDVVISDMRESDLDYETRSHMLLGVLYAAFAPAVTERQEHLEYLKQQIVKAGRLDSEVKAEEWIKQVLEIMEPYANNKTQEWPVDIEERSRLLKAILEENGQLFGRWRLAKDSKEFNFKLGPILSMIDNKDAEA